jgi:hypothetical protein
MRAFRLAAVLGAVIVCAWFVLGARQAHEIDQATNIVTVPRQSAAKLRAAARDLHAAALLNPDRTVDILRARVAIEQGRPTQARRILTAVTRAEPDNLEAWISYTGANLGRPNGRRGLAAMIRLDPIDARALGH